MAQYNQIDDGEWNCIAGQPCQRIVDIRFVAEAEALHSM